MPIFLHFMPAQRITLRVVLQHMENMQSVLLKEIRKVDSRVDGLGRRMDVFEQKADRRHRLVMTGLDNIDRRLDDVEVKELPRIRSKLHLRRISSRARDLPY